MNKNIKVEYENFKLKKKKKILQLNINIIYIKKKSLQREILQCPLAQVDFSTTEVSYKSISRLYLKPTKM